MLSQELRESEVYLALKSAIQKYIEKTKQEEVEKKYKKEKTDQEEDGDEPVERCGEDREREKRISAEKHNILSHLAICTSHNGLEAVAMGALVMGTVMQQFQVPCQHAALLDLSGHQLLQKEVAFLTKSVCNVIGECCNTGGDSDAGGTPEC